MSYLAGYDDWKTTTPEDLLTSEGECDREVEKDCPDCEAEGVTEAGDDCARCSGTGVILDFCGGELFSDNRALRCDSCDYYYSHADARADAEGY